MGLQLGTQVIIASSFAPAQVRSMVDEGALGFGFPESWEFKLLGSSWPYSVTINHHDPSNHHPKSHDRRQIPRSADPQEKTVNLWKGDDFLSRQFGIVLATVSVFLSSPFGKVTILLFGSQSFLLKKLFKQSWHPVESIDLKLKQVWMLFDYKLKVFFAHPCWWKEWYFGLSSSHHQNTLVKKKGPKQ